MYCRVYIVGYIHIAAYAKKQQSHIPVHLASSSNKTVFAKTIVNRLSYSKANTPILIN